jgi:hypothetical protein
MMFHEGFVAYEAKLKVAPPAEEMLAGQTWCRSQLSIIV